MLLACSFAAGMRSASLTQIVQCAVLLAVSLVTLALLLWQRGALVPALGDANLRAALDAIALEAFAADDTPNRLALLFCVAAGIAALPHLLLRSLVTPSIEGARASFLWAIPFTALLCVVAAPLLTLFGEVPAATGNRTALMTFGFAATGAIAALLALGSLLALALTNALSYDLYYKLVHPRASTLHRIFVARSTIVVVALLAAWAALTRPEAMLAMTGSSLFARGERISARAPSRHLVETRKRRGRSCRHAGRTCRVSLLHARFALRSVRILRDVELSLQCHGRRGRAVQRLASKLLPCRCGNARHGARGLGRDGARCRQLGRHQNRLCRPLRRARRARW